MALDQEPDDLDQEAEPLDQEDGPGPNDAPWVWSCGCVATNGRGAHHPHRFMGYCRACSDQHHDPIPRYACGAPRIAYRRICRCEAPAVLDERPRHYPRSPTGQRSLF